MLAAYRYADAYVKVADRWQFAERRIAFMYCVPGDQLAGSFRDAERIQQAAEASDRDASSTVGKRSGLPARSRTL